MTRISAEVKRTGQLTLPGSLQRNVKLASACCDTLYRRLMGEMSCLASVAIHTRAPSVQGQDWASAMALLGDNMPNRLRGAGKSCVEQHDAREPEPELDRSIDHRGLCQAGFGGSDFMSIGLSLRHSLHSRK